MMSHFLENDFSYGILLLWLESTFVLVSLMILHHLRKIIGTAPIHLTLGILIVFAHLAASAQIQMYSVLSNSWIDLSGASIILPCLAILLIIYVQDGTLAAQRIVIAVMAGLGMFVYAKSIILLQCSWTGSAIMPGGVSNLLQNLLDDTSRHMTASTIAVALDIFLIPVIYQRLKNLGANYFFSTAVALLIGQFFDTVILSGVYLWGETDSFAVAMKQVIPQSILCIWLSVIVAIYFLRNEHQQPRERRSATDIFVAFFGAYGKTKLLEQTLYESEQRYRTIIQNAGDLILLTSGDGIIVDVNQSAEASLQTGDASQILGKNISEILPGLPPFSEIKSGNILHVNLPLLKKELEIGINQISVDGMPAYVLVGRDITERERIAREREVWRTETSHRQRLEAIGRLAGGIAHDFNNHLHAILGHLDLIYMEGASENIMPHLEKIDNISQQAAKLTGQLLGYARKGRRLNIRLKLASLINDSLELFLPDSRSGVNITRNVEKADIFVLGDPTQLQQAVLNLLINAKDAMENLPDSQRNITVSAGSVAFLNLTLNPSVSAAKTHPSPDKLCAIQIMDSGPGVPADILEKIFEPFFTTKPVGKGTGMGLSMSSGVALEHGGWIQYGTKPDGTGAVFSLILPIAEEDAEVS